MNERETKQCVMKGGLPFNLSDWKNVSELARDFVVKCLSSKLEERPTAQELL